MRSLVGQGIQSRDQLVLHIFSLDLEAVFPRLEDIPEVVEWYRCPRFSREVAAAISTTPRSLMRHLYHAKW